MAVKTISLRVPPPLYDKARKLARQRGISMNRLFMEGLEQFQKQAEEARLYQEFTLLGEDYVMSDVEFCQAAQSEILKHES